MITGIKISDIIIFIKLVETLEIPVQSIVDNVLQVIKAETKKAFTDFYLSSNKQQERTVFRCIVSPRLLYLSRKIKHLLCRVLIGPYSQSGETQPRVALVHNSYSSGHIIFNIRVSPAQYDLQFSI